MKYSREILVGVVSLLALAVLVVAAMVVRVGEFEPKKILAVRFDTAGGLERGGKVLVSGVEVGNVADIRLDRGDALVTIHFRQTVDLFPDAKFFIDVPLALAKPLIRIDPGTPGKNRLKVSGLHGTSSPNVMQELAPILAKLRQGDSTIGKLFNETQLYDDVLATVDEIHSTISSARKIVQGVEQGGGTVGKLLTDETLYNEAKQAVASARSAIRKLDDGKGPLALLLNDEKVSGQLREAIDSIAQITGKINKGKGAVGVLLNDDQVGRDLTETVAAVKRITSQVEAGEGLLAALLNDKEVGAQFKSIVSDVNEVTRGLRSGEGTLGKLLRDESVFDGINSLLKRLNDSIEDAREQAPISSFTFVLLGALQ